MSKNDWSDTYAVAAALRGPEMGELWSALRSRRARRS